jgi:predicted nucleotidyltransferase
MMLYAMSVAELPIPIDREEIAAFCRAHGIARLELFGSALREDFRGDSDLDMLCTPRAGAKCGLFEWVALNLALEKILGRTVDLVSRPGIKRSRNPYRRKEILKTARPIYVEG